MVPGSISKDERRRKAQELLTRHIIAWDEQKERAAERRQDSGTVLDASVQYREKVRVDAINEARRRQNTNTSWEASLRAVETTQSVPIGNIFSGLQCTVSTDPNAANIHSLIHMPRHEDPTTLLPEDLKEQVIQNRADLALKTTERQRRPLAELPDLQYSRSELRSSLLSMTASFSGNPAETVHETPQPLGSEHDEEDHEGDEAESIYTSRTGRQGALSMSSNPFAQKTQRLPAGVAAQRADKLAAYINEQNTRNAATYVPDIRFDVEQVNTNCIVEPIIFAASVTHPKLRISRLTVVTHHSRDNVGGNVATITVTNIGDSVISLRVIPKTVTELPEPEAPQEENPKSARKRPNSRESTRSIMSIRSSQPMQKIQQNIGGQIGNSVNRILELVNNDPKRTGASVASRATLGANLLSFGITPNSGDSMRKDNIETISGTIAANSGGMDPKRLILKSTTPLELRLLANRFIKENKDVDTNLFVSTPAATWSLNPGASTVISFILPVSETGVATPGIVLREYYLITSPAVDVSFQSLEDMLHADHLVETAPDFATTRINLRCYGIASDFLQAANSIRALMKRGSLMMTNLYSRQMSNELVHELVNLACEASRVSDKLRHEVEVSKVDIKRDITERVLNVHHKRIVATEWLENAEDIKEFLIALVTFCDGLDLSVPQILPEYTDGYFRDEVVTDPENNSIEDRRLYGIYGLADSNATTDPNRAPLPATSRIEGGDLSHKEAILALNTATETSAIPRLSIPMTAKFVIIKAETRFRTALTALRCSVTRFNHEVLPVKQLLFYKNSPFYLRLAATNLVILRAHLMTWKRKVEATESAPFSEQSNNEVSTNFVEHLDKYRRSSLDLVSQYIVVDGFSDHAESLLMLDDLNEIDVWAFKRGIATSPEILALTAPLAPSLFCKFLMDKIGRYCQDAAEKHIIKYFNRGKRDGQPNLELLPTGILCCTTHATWAEAIDKLFILACGTPSTHPIGSVFGLEFRTVSDEVREACALLVKIRHLLTEKVHMGIGGFVPYLWDAILSQLGQYSTITTTRFTQDSPQFKTFIPASTVFDLRAVYYKLCAQIKTVAEEEAARQELERAAKKPAAQKASLVEEEPQTPKTLASFADEFSSYAIYYRDDPNDPLEGMHLGMLLKASDSSETLQSEDREGIVADQNQALHTIVLDVVTLIIRECVCLRTLMTRKYVYQVYHDINPNKIDPHGVGRTFPNPQAHWPTLIAQEPSFDPLYLPGLFLETLFQHYETTVFGRQVQQAQRNQYLPKGKGTARAPDPLDSATMVSNFTKSYLLPFTCNTTLDRMLKPEPTSTPVGSSEAFSCYLSCNTNKYCFVNSTPASAVSPDIPARTRLEEVLRRGLTEGPPTATQDSKKLPPKTPKEEGTLPPAQSLVLPPALAGVFFADTDPRTIPTRLFSKEFFTRNAAFLAGPEQVRTEPPANPKGPPGKYVEDTAALDETLDLLTITSLQPHRPLRLNEVLVDAVIASTQLAAFPRVEAIDNIVHYISRVSYSGTDAIFARQIQVINAARDKLRERALNVCCCLYAQSLGIPLPISLAPADPKVKGKSAGSTPSEALDALSKFRKSLDFYLQRHLTSSTVYLDPNLLLHLGKMHFEEYGYPDRRELVRFFQGLTNYANLSIYDYRNRDLKPFTGFTRQTEDVGLEIEPEPIDIEDNKLTSESDVATPIVPSTEVTRSKGHTGLSLNLDLVRTPTDDVPPYLGLKDRLADSYAEELSEEDRKRFYRSRDYFLRIGERVTSTKRFTQPRVGYVPEFKEPLNIPQIIYDLKVACFRREFDTFIDAIFTPQTENLIEMHAENLRVYEDDLDEYELFYQKILSIEEGTLTLEEAGLEEADIVPSAQLTPPPRPKVTTLDVFQEFGADVVRDSSLVRRYAGFTYSAAYQKASIEYLVEGLIVTALKLLPIAKKAYRSQAPEEYDAQDYEARFDTALWEIFLACGYGPAEVQQIRCRYLLQDAPDDAESPHTQRHMTVSLDECTDECSSASAALLSSAHHSDLETSINRPVSANLTHQASGTMEASNTNSSSTRPGSGGVAAGETCPEVERAEDGLKDDSHQYTPPVIKPQSSTVPTDAFIRLCGLFSIAPRTDFDLATVHERAKNGEVESPTVSLQTFLGDIRTTSMTPFDSVYSYLHVHNEYCTPLGTATKALKFPPYLLLMTPDGPFGSVIADDLVQPSVLKCENVVDITEENALSFALRLGFVPPKPDPKAKPKTPATKNSPQRQVTVPSTAPEAPAEPEPVAEQETPESDEDLEEEEQMEWEEPPEYIAPMDKPVEADVAARRDVWAELFDRFLARAFAWVDACEAVPELLVRTVNYSVRDLANFADPEVFS
ncbi:hypothetical protein GMRT_13322 [Giardia muris]|uniref:Uncharacterized protein n=1 Tax=Giardia muris TaxID=5742 RepID=A0A4Z1SN64_GIAMU|nr:hypothetical protein GMRT_13322 [Giardia muris]|eukprot:TNJ26285.1 hypothetical protein GMRT_13322 [Giardia muris]